MEIKIKNEYIVPIIEKRQGRSSCDLRFYPAEPNNGSGYYSSGTMILRGKSIWEAYKVFTYRISDKVRGLAIDGYKSKYYHRRVTKGG